eukprot:8885815-Pyramimonas_sp.AAC.1
MADHGLKAANTFATRQPTWESWGENRFVTQKRVLDYLLVPYHWNISKVGAQWFYKNGGKLQSSRLSDHAMVSGTFSDPGRTIIRRRALWESKSQVQKSLRGYRCTTWADEFEAGRRADLCCGGASFGYPERPSVYLDPTKMSSDLLSCYVNDA